MVDYVLKVKFGCVHFVSKGKQHFQKGFKGDSCQWSHTCCSVLTALFDYMSKCLRYYSSKSLTEILHAEANEQEEGVQNAHKANKKPEPAPEAKPDVPETTANAEEPERSDSDDSDDSI